MGKYRPYKFGTDPEFLVAHVNSCDKEVYSYRDANALFSESNGSYDCDDCDIDPCYDCDNNPEECDYDRSECRRDHCGGCDGREGDSGHGEKVGSDGHLGEFRPKEALTPKQAVLHLQELITSLKHHAVYGYNNYKFIVGGGEEARDSLGSHIHISWLIPSGANPLAYLELYDAPSNSHSRLENFLSWLDFFVGIPLKEAKGGQRHESSGYGANSTHHIHTHKRTPKFDVFGIEYRTPPSFIKTPELYEAVMETAEKVATLFMGDKEDVLQKIRNDQFRKHGYKSFPSYESYNELGLSIKNASIMSSLDKIDIGGAIDIERWESWTPNKVIKNRPSPRSNHKVRYSLSLDTWVIPLRRNK